MTSEYDNKYGKQKSTSTQLWSHTTANKYQAVVGKEYLCLQELLGSLTKSSAEAVQEAQKG